MRRLFYIVGLLEAWSFLILLGIAMPLKYLAGQPDAVRVVGMAHGVLFLAYLTLAFMMYQTEDWSFKKLAAACLAAVFPFGPLLFHRAYPS